MTRRDFCCGIGTSAVLAVGSSVFAATPEAPGKRRLRLTLNPGAIGVRANQEEAIDLAARHGFEAVEPYPGDLAKLAPDQMQAVLAGLKAKKLEWGAAGLPVEFRRDEDRLAADLKALEPLAAGLQRAGVERVGTWLSPGHDRLSYLQNFRQHQRRLKAVAEILKGHGLRLGLEYVGTYTLWATARYPFIHTLAETRDLIAEIGTGNVGLVLDSWHWWQAGDTGADLRTLRAEDVVAVDLNDAPSGVEKNRQKDGERELPAATGVIEVRPFLGVLNELGYDGPMRAEPFNRRLNELENEPACAATIGALRRAVGEG